MLAVTEMVLGVWPLGLFAQDQIGTIASTPRTVINPISVGEISDRELATESGWDHISESVVIVDRDRGSDCLSEMIEFRKVTGIWKILEDDRLDPSFRGWEHVRFIYRLLFAPYGFVTGKRYYAETSSPNHLESESMPLVSEIDDDGVWWVFNIFRMDNNLDIRGILGAQRLPCKIISLFSNVPLEIGGTAKDQATDEDCNGCDRGDGLSIGRVSYKSGTPLQAGLAHYLCRRVRIHRSWIDHRLRRAHIMRISVGSSDVPSTGYRPTTL